MIRPWYVDLATFILVGVWMALTFGTIQRFGPSPVLIAGAVSVAIVGVLAVYGQRLRYLRIGDTIEIGLRTPDHYEPNGGERGGRDQNRSE